MLIITPLFPLLLFATAFDWGIVKTVGHPPAVKQIASESGIYDSLIPSLLTKVKQVDTSLGSLSATDPAVSTAANQAFSPKYIQSSTETIIDSVYAWLDGKTAEPNFSLDLSAPKTNFADSLASQFQQKAASLPKCTSAVSAASFNISSASCLPAGITPASVGQTIKDDVAGGKGFIDNTVISANSVKGSNSNQSIFEGQLKSFPSRYQLIKKTPTILAILTLAAASSIFFLSPNHRKGLRHLGITLLVVGLLMLVFSWGLNKGVSTQLTPKITINDNPVMTTKVRALVTDIAQRVDKNYWAFGAVYSVLGAAAIAAPMIIRKRTPRAATTSAGVTAADGVSEPPKTESKPKHG